MSNRLFQNVIGQYRGTVDRIFGITDEEGRVVACSEPNPPSDLRMPSASDRIISGNSEIYISGGFTFRQVGTAVRSQYFVFVEGTDRLAETVSAVLSVSFANLKRLYDDRNDRASFIRNIVLDNILPEEIPLRARDMHMPIGEDRVVFIIRTEGKSGTDTVDVLQNMFPDRQRDFIFPANESDTVLVKNTKSGSQPEEARELAVRISDMLGTELFTRVRIGISDTAGSLGDLPLAYRQAHASLEVCAVLGTEQNVAEYSRLGIGRLLYMLPETLCESYLKEVFRYGSMDSLDPEILTTVQVFFDNSLNVSETARKLFIHRNTLAYRLDKIQTLTGLDIRVFDDAIAFCVALMVSRYLKSKKPQNGGESGRKPR